MPELGCQAKKFDYHAIAENPEPQGIGQVRSFFSDPREHPLLTVFPLQLLAVMLSAAAMGPDNQRFVPRIQSGLDKQTQAEIMQIIRIMQQDITNSRGDEDLDEALDAVMEARDMDLIVEEQNAELRQELDMTKKNLSDYITRLEYLQQSHEELKYEKEKNDRELEVMRKATQDGANSAESIKILEAQVHEQMEIIARNEETIRKYERSQAHLESEVQRLTQKSIELDELRDQVMEWKHKAEDMEKKANTADRYKQKLESQQHLVKEVQNLQYEKADLQEQLRSLANDHERNTRTRKAEDELTKMITQSEQHLWDERNQKTQLMKDMTALEEEIVLLRARQSHDENFIKDLQEQIQASSGTQGGVAGDSGAAFNLEDELNIAADDGQVNISLELSRLKTENNLLRTTVGSAGDSALLRRERDETKRQLAHVQSSFNEIFEKHAVAQDQIEALIKNMTDEGLVQALAEAKPGSVLTGDFYRSQAFINLRTQLMQANFELEQLQKLNQDLNAQLADQGRDLLDVKSQLSVVGKDSTEAMNILKNTDRLLSESLKVDLERAREEISLGSSDRENLKTQLVDALLAKDRYWKMVEEGKDMHDASPSDADPSEQGKKSSEKLEKIRVRLIQLRQVSANDTERERESESEGESKPQGRFFDVLGAGDESSQVADSSSDVSTEDDDEDEDDLWPFQDYMSPNGDYSDSSTGDVDTDSDVDASDTLVEDDSDDADDEDEDEDDDLPSKPPPIVIKHSRVFEDMDESFPSTPASAPWDRQCDDPKTNPGFFSGLFFGMA